MVNKNFISVVCEGLTRTSQQIKRVDGTLHNTDFSNSFTGTNKDKLSTDYSDGAAGCYLLVGTGTTPPTIDDYKLDSLVSNYTVLAQTHTLIAEYSASAFIITRTIQNPSLAEPLTIKEVGLFGGDGQQLYMLAREVLDEPVILQPGEKHAFTMTIALD